MEIIFFIQNRCHPCLPRPYSPRLWRRLLRKLGVSSGGLIMVGDGINDAPALAAATAGISLEAADGALQSNAVEGGDVLVLRRAGDPQGDSDLRRAWGHGENVMDIDGKHMEIMEIIRDLKEIREILRVFKG